MNESRFFIKHKGILLAATCILLSLSAVFSLQIFASSTFINDTDYFNRNQIEKGKNYCETKRTLWISSILLTGTTLILLSASKTGIRLRVALAMISDGKPWLMTLLTSITTLGLLKLVKAPLSFYSSFTVGHRFGISSQTLSGWFYDYLTGATINITILTIGLMSLYTFMSFWEQKWWIPGALMTIGAAAILTWIGPVVIAPVFNSFTPLENKELEQKIYDLAKKANVPVSKILVVDASKRTKALNAYYTGLANTRRIVIYDNLLENLSNDEIVSIIAHELGHWKKNHIKKGLALAVGGIFCSAFFLFKLMEFICKERLWGLYKPADSATIPLLLLIVIFIQTASIPIESIISRAFEREADQIALELTDDPESFISVERKLAISNLADIRPPQWYAFLFHSHPTVMERIKAAIDYSRLKRGENLQKKADSNL